MEKGYTDILRPEEQLALEKELADADRAHAANRRKIVTQAVEGAKRQRQIEEMQQTRTEKLAKAKDFIEELKKAGVREHVAIRFAESDYSPDEHGTWAVYGEDPNYDFNGTHYNPELGLFEGMYKDICIHAHGLKAFYTRGFGGTVKKVTATKVIKIG